MSLTKNIDRKEFFAAMGISSAALALVCCVGCSASQAKVSTTAAVIAGLNFTLDLNAPANAALKANGGFITSHNLIIARTSSGDYIAAQQACTHQGFTLAYQSDDSQYMCSAHGSTFSEKGIVVNGPAAINLATYKTALSGTSLRIFS